MAVDAGRGGRGRAVLSKPVALGGAIGALSGAGLLLATFLPWYGDPLSGETLTAWQALEWIDLICAACGLVSISPELSRRMSLSVSYPVAGSAIACGAGLLAFALVLFRILDPPFDYEGGIDREPGIWLALVASAGIVFGGYLGMKEDPT